MLSNTLNTNEVKNAAGTEVEFQHRRQEGQLHEYAQISETFNLPHRLIVSHREKGIGVAATRSSAVIVSKTVLGANGVDPVTIKATLSINIPVGKLSSSTETKNVLAELLSFCATTGAGTTVLFDCSGSGAGALVDGGL